MPYFVYAPEAYRRCRGDNPFLSCSLQACTRSFMYARTCKIDDACVACALIIPGGAISLFVFPFSLVLALCCTRGGMHVYIVPPFCEIN